MAALFLLVVAGLRGKLGMLWKHAGHISVAGVFAAGLPFLLFNFAAQSVPAGVMAVINAMTPLFGALIARLWLKEKLTRMRVAGLLLGFVGIIVLVWTDLSFGAGGMGPGVLACLSASLCYGYAANYTTRHLKGVDPIALAAGAITASAVMLLPFAVYAWPTTPVSFSAWSAALALSLLCTGLAYIVFYSLIDRVGAIRSITVTFLVPLFGILWGVLFLHEPLSPRMVIATAIVLLGTLLATGFIAAGKPGSARQ